MLDQQVDVLPYLNEREGPAKAEAPLASRAIVAGIAIPHWIAMAAITIGIVYALLVQPGTAADEPAHFSNIIYYAKHLRMPVLGDPEVRYEGQMGPLYYGLNAVLYAALNRLGDESAFYVLRGIGLLLFWPMTILAYRIAARLRGRADLAAALSALFMVVNPSILAIASSLQNDILAIVLCMWAIDLCGSWLCTEAEPTAESGMLLAVVVSAGVLAKATVTFMLFGIPLVAMMFHGGRALKFVTTFSVSSVLFCGWWFLRNLLLYGDATAQAALTKFRYGNNPDPAPIWVLRNFGRWIWGIIAYHWGSTEYYRHLFSAPFWYRAVAGSFTAVAVVGWIKLVQRQRLMGQQQAINTRYARGIAILCACCIAIFVYSCLRITSFAARCAFPIYIVFAVFLCFGITFAFGERSRRARAAAIGLQVASLVAMNLFSLLTIARMAKMPFNPF